MSTHKEFSEALQYIMFGKQSLITSGSFRKYRNYFLPNANIDYEHEIKPDCLLQNSDKQTTKNPFSPLSKV